MRVFGILLGIVLSGSFAQANDVLHSFSLGYIARETIGPVDNDLVLGTYGRTTPDLWLSGTLGGRSETENDFSIILGAEAARLRPRTGGRDGFGGRLSFGEDAPSSVELFYGREWWSDTVTWQVLAGIEAAEDGTLPSGDDLGAFAFAGLRYAPRDRWAIRAGLSVQDSGTLGLVGATWQVRRESQTFLFLDYARGLGRYGGVELYDDLFFGVRILTGRGGVEARDRAHGGALFQRVVQPR